MIEFFFHKYFLLIFLIHQAVSGSSPQKCLFPNFETNYTRDGLENCTCSPGYDYDDNFGVCFRNYCKVICGEMQCVLRKSNPVNGMNPMCYCEPNFISISKEINIGCVPFESSSGFKEIGENLPKNPLFLKHLKCNQTYRLIGDKYECSCFSGYTLKKSTGECILEKKCDKICGPNQICTLDDSENQICTCKTGFSGLDCLNHFCDYKNATEKEKAYIKLSLKGVCGTEQCILNETKNDFECNCLGFDMTNREDGLCTILKPCLSENYGYKKCSQENRFCLIDINNWGDKFRCLPSLEQRNERSYKPKFEKPRQITYKLSFKARLTWWDGSFFVIFLNQHNNMINPKVEKTFPGWLYKEFVEYEQNIFWLIETYEFYKPQVEDKLRNIIFKGMKGFHPIRDYCGNHSYYPELTYDKENFKMSRLVETIFDVEVHIYCERKNKTVDQLLDLFTNHFLLKELYEGYFYLRETGYIIPDSIKLIEVPNDDTEDDDNSDEIKNYNRCLRAYQKTNLSLDGLTNCTCADGYDFDLVFGVCFRNLCEEICTRNGMKCAILKHDVNHFEYHCYCEPGFQKIDPYNPLGCISTHLKYIDLVHHSNEKGFPLPLNPFLLDHFNCDQTYKLDSLNNYTCTCFLGYQMNKTTKKCEKIQELIAFRHAETCNDNQIFVILDTFGMKGKCVCKAGFGGLDCKFNLCNFPKNTTEEADYIHNSIEQFCGQRNCSLAFDQFVCKCAEPFYKDKDGRCELRKDCTEEENYGNCKKENKFCKILSNDLQKRSYECKCSKEEGGNEIGKCLEYKVKDHSYCPPGYVMDKYADRDQTSECVLGQSTFNLTLQIRFDLIASNNKDDLLANYFDLEDSISLKNVPVRSTEEFLDYRERSLNYSMNSVMSKLIIRDKLGTILRNAIIKSNFNSLCHYINPIVNLKETELNLFKILELLMDSSVSITCANKVSGREFLRTFKYYLKHNKVTSRNANYFYLPRVGFIEPESLKIVNLNK